MVERILSDNVNKQVRHVVSAPFIFAVIIPLVIFDFFIEVYHRICFPLYRIELVRRRDYVKIDRHKLSYLNPIEKVFCAYCGYANGLLAYGVEIAGRTEHYWCSVKHEEDENFNTPNHHDCFADYGDEDNIERRHE